MNVLKEMRLYCLTQFLLLLAVTCCYAQGSGSSPKWQRFTVEKLLEQREQSQRPYLHFLDESSISAGLYVLEAGTTDQQSPHGRDEIYYVLKGQALLKIKEEHVEVKPGNIVYVKADIPHQFVQITQPLEVLVIFSNGDSKEAPDFLLFELGDLQAKSDPDGNVWNAFLDVPTLQFGLYLLPEEIGGDGTLMHNVDEINIVVNGRGKFKMGDDDIDVAPGNVVFVKQGVRHYFHSLQENLDILILFHKKN